MIKTNQNVFFFFIKRLLNVETAIKRTKKQFYLQSMQFQRNCMLVTYITDRKGRNTDLDELKVTVSLLF